MPARGRHHSGRDVSSILPEQDPPACCGPLTLRLRNTAVNPSTKGWESPRAYYPYRYRVHTLRMIRSFRHRGRSRLYERGDRIRVGADQAQRLAMALADLDDAVKPSDIDLPGYRLHRLKGHLKDFRSITISANWRMAFRFEDGDIYDVDLVDCH